jgi:hypothetical protein
MIKFVKRFKETHKEWGFFFLFLFALMIVNFSLLKFLWTAPTWSDTEYFAKAGRLLLGGDFGVYRDPSNQGGPLVLLYAAMVSSKMRGGVVFGSVVSVMLMSFVTAAVGVCLKLLTETPKRVSVNAAALSVLAAGIPFGGMRWGTMVAQWGHPEYIVIPLLWLLGVVLIHRQSKLRNPFVADLLAASVLGVSIWWTSWGVLGFPLLVLGVNWSRYGLLRVMRRCVIGVIVGVSVYVPFVMSGEFKMFDIKWSNILLHGTLLTALFGQVDSAPWSYRALQAGLVGVGGLTAAVSARRTPQLWWFPVLVIVVMRMLTEVFFWNYYWSSWFVILIPVFGFAFARGDKRSTIGWGIVLVLCSLQPFTPFAGLLWIVFVFTCILAVHVCERMWYRRNAPVTEVRGDTSVHNGMLTT